MPAGDATAPAPPAEGAMPTRGSGVFEPLLRTSHRILELLRLDAGVTTDPISAPAAPPAAQAPDDAGQLLKPAVDAAAAVVQAAPDLLASWLKRMTPTDNAPDAPPTCQAVAADGTNVPPTDLPTAAQPPAAHAIKQLIDSMPAQIVTNQQSDEPKDPTSSRPIDLPAAPLFVDGHALRGHAITAQPDTSAQTLRLDVPMRSPEWAQALGERITWLVDQKLSAAEIRLNPPQLGPIEVRIALSADSTQVSVLAHNAITREALDAAAPRLREALTSHGFGGVSVDISQQSFADRPMAQSSLQRWESWQALAPDSAVDGRAPAARWPSRGQLDAYA
jgi:flagellar hook-length control protein FliK